MFGHHHRNVDDSKKIGTKRFLFEQEIMDSTKISFFLERRNDKSQKMMLLASNSFDNSDIVFESKYNLIKALAAIK